MENGLSTSRLVDMYNEAETFSYDARKESERARDYWDGHQLTADEMAELARRKQPAIVVNRVRRKVQWLKGIEIKQRTDPKAFPRTPEHEQGAEAITDALRFVADNVRFDRARSRVWDSMLIEGFGGVEVMHKQKPNGEVDIVLNHYSWDRLFYDPHSTQHDFSDARYVGAVVWRDIDDLLQEFPKMKAKVAEMATASQTAETYDDKPKFGQWYDSKRKRVREVVIWYKRGGDWYWCRHVETEKLDGGKSPYVNEDGETQCALILQSMYVGRDNARYGVVRDMFGPQDEINKRRSKSLHLLNVRQARYSGGADAARIARELAKPDGVIDAEADEFEILPTGDMASGQLTLLQEAKDEIDLMGANSALAGETGESASGRAVMARQQGGMIEIAPEEDELRWFTQRVFEAFWNRIRQFWTNEKWVRVTDDERNIRFVTLNRPVTFGEMLGQQPPEVAQAAAMQMHLTPNDPRLSAVVDVENNVAEMMVDVIIDEAPDRISLAGETFEALLKYGQALPPQVLIEADPTLPASKKEKLLEAMQQQQPTPMQQLEMAEKEAGVAEKQAKAQKLAAEAQTLPLAKSFAAGM